MRYDDVAPTSAPIHPHHAPAYNTSSVRDDPRRMLSLRTAPIPTSRGPASAPPAAHTRWPAPPPLAPFHTPPELGLHGALLALALGTHAEVTAFHHQGVRAVDGDLRIVARHTSGLPLAVEADSGSSVLGVQWHPEIDGERGAAVFESLLTAIRHREVSAPATTLV